MGEDFSELSEIWVSGSLMGKTDYNTDRREKKINGDERKWVS